MKFNKFWLYDKHFGLDKHFVCLFQIFQNKFQIGWGGGLAAVQKRGQVLDEIIGIFFNR